MLDTTWVNFWAKQTTLNFLSNLPKNEFWYWNLENLDLELGPTRYYDCQFLVKTDNFKFFGLNLEKLPDYMQHFGSNNIKGCFRELGGH